jgi:hypothetical protein
MEGGKGENIPKYGEKNEQINVEAALLIIDILERLFKQQDIVDTLHIWESTDVTTLTRAKDYLVNCGIDCTFDNTKHTFTILGIKNYEYTVSKLNDFIKLHSKIKNMTHYEIFYQMISLIYSFINLCKVDEDTIAVAFASVKDSMFSDNEIGQITTGTLPIAANYKHSRDRIIQLTQASLTEGFVAEAVVSDRIQSGGISHYKLQITRKS